MSLCERKKIYINFYNRQDSVVEGPKMTKMTTHDHWLKCGSFDQMYNWLAFCGTRPSLSCSAGPLGAKEEMHVSCVSKEAWCSREEVLHPASPVPFQLAGELSCLGQP